MVIYGYYTDYISQWVSKTKTGTALSCDPAAEKNKVNERRGNQRWAKITSRSWVHVRAVCLHMCVRGRAMNVPMRRRLKDARRRVSGSVCLSSPCPPPPPAPDDGWHRMRSFLSWTADCSRLPSKETAICFPLQRPVGPRVWTCFGLFSLLWQLDRAAEKSRPAGELSCRGKNKLKLINETQEMLLIFNSTGLMINQPGSTQHCSCNWDYF